ncbi:MAG TPA: CsbD family protein [Terracidiphilus sp.]|nr:CsbD family protein [Terracidiphilus sp.]
MKSSSENRAKGKMHEVKGAIKEKLGKVTNDPRLQGEGVGEKIAGKIQNTVGHVQKVVEKP